MMTKHTPFKPLLRCLILCSSVPLAFAQLPLPNGGDIRAGILPKQWMTGGPKCMEIPEWQVHEYNPDLYILRQSGCTDYEKPFVYLLFGKQRGLVLDTGSRNGNLAPTLERTVNNWLRRNKRDSIPLVVIHSHSHSDHVAGDAAIQAIHDPAMPIVFIKPDLPAMQGFAQIANWPEDVGHADLGDRMLDIVAIPGHDVASVALYDRQTAILFTGDSLYPGRLYVHDLAAFQASTERMIRFTKGKPVAHILGCHIEETRTPYLDYEIGTIYQPDEHELSLSRGALLELEEALLLLNGKPARLALRDFTIWPVGRSYTMSTPTQSVFDKVQKEQLEHMWNQPKQ
jgi:glyoxylase-like metal-dependent hydrolase (beta-lactamase superfamily II)